MRALILWLVLAASCFGQGSYTPPAAGGGGSATTTWVDVGETITIGNAVGNWPDCTNGTENKTASTATTSFAGLTGYDATKHRWALVNIALAATATGRTVFFHHPDTPDKASMLFSSTTLGQSNANFIATAVGVTRYWTATIPFDENGDSNIWCNNTDAGGTTGTVTVVALY